MAQLQIKVALNALARAGIVVREHDANGSDVGDAVELDPGKSHSASFDEGSSLVIVEGAAAEPKKGKTAADQEPVNVTLTVEGDSTHGAAVVAKAGIAEIYNGTVTDAEPLTLALGNEAKIRVTRGKAIEREDKPAEEPAAA